MTDRYTLNEIAMMFDILKKSGRLEDMNEKFPDLKFDLGDRNTQLELGRELWSALDDVKDKEPKFYQSVIDMHDPVASPVPCPCRPRKA